jgi:hypothetical protein
MQPWSGVALESDLKKPLKKKWEKLARLLGWH